MNHAAGGPVIIVGAGPVGLGCALELARFGVRSVLIARGWRQPTYQRLDDAVAQILAAHGA